MPRRGQRWFTYFVRCADGSLYCGATNDLERRVEAHNLGRGARYTRSRTPVKLVWSRRLANRSKAMSLEARLKQLTRAEKLQWVRQSRHGVIDLVNAKPLKLLKGPAAR
ncbi:MAG: GIY-YIG nuclease family protein [Myxococcaceae bacterium]|nr:GIY-YIG nuclease family protein [Myxococcaceae bacterium]